MRFSRVELVNWKNFQEADVELPDRVFLVGPNASGKSNFLDVFRFLRDLAVPGGGLRNACESRGGVSAIRFLWARKPSHIEIKVELEDEDRDSTWRYEIAFTQASKFPRQGTPSLIREVVEKDGKRILNRHQDDEDERDDPLRLTQTALEQINANQKFREIAEFFSKVSYLHLIPQIVRNAGGLAFDPSFPDIFGGQFLKRVADTPEKTRAARLRRIFQVLQVLVPQYERLEVKRDDQGIPHLEVLYKHWRPRAGLQDESQMSDGTLRLVALLWALQDGDGPLLMEEPELSLHVGVVRKLPSLMHQTLLSSSSARGRQVIISTHSAELLSDEGISGHETFLLKLVPEGATIYRAVDNHRIRVELEAGLSVADAVLPETAPDNPLQLSLPFNQG